MIRQSIVAGVVAAGVTALTAVIVHGTVAIAGGVFLGTIAGQAVRGATPSTRALGWPELVARGAVAAASGALTLAWLTR